MATNVTPNELIALALQLPPAERERISEALRESLIDESIDHGPEDPNEEVEAAWGDEIARRIADIDSGRVKTIPSDEAERMIRGDVRPSV